jgi:DNA adenine methylase
MRTPITYYGGKQSMVKLIIPMIPAHKIYCEPFFGGGAVFFSKTPSYLEVINDTNNRLITFYEQMRDNFEALNGLISTTLHSEKMHLKARDIYYGRIQATPTEIAWSVWVLTNMSFSGSIHGGWKWCNGTKGSHSVRFISKKALDFTLLKNRLQNVQISNKNALEVIQQRDTTDTFFYLDPPYPGAKQAHYYGYSMKDFSELLEILRTIKGKFLLSNFWSQTLKHYAITTRWNIKSITKHLKIANFPETRYKTEILVSNYNGNNDLFSNLT